MVITFDFKFQDHPDDVSNVEILDFTQAVVTWLYQIERSWTPNNCDRPFQRNTTKNNSGPSPEEKYLKESPVLERFAPIKYQTDRAKGIRQQKGQRDLKSTRESQHSRV
jgi:hypothetical protein